MNANTLQMNQTRVNPNSRFRPVPTAFCAFLFSICIYLVAPCRAVPFQHVAFVILSSLYALFTNVHVKGRYDAPRVNNQPLRSRSLSPVRNSARLLFPFTFMFSLLVPIFLLSTTDFCSINRNSSTLYSILAPHLFLMISQILLETIGFIFSTFFSLYVRFGLTIAMVSYRIPVAFKWYFQAEQYALTDQAALLPPFVLLITQVAAILNIVYWIFALLCFLILYCLPAIVREPHNAPATNYLQRTDKPEETTT